MRDQIQTLKTISIGESVAEREKQGLAGYFVETEAWQKLYGGLIDIVYGAKGTGKSALYLLLTDKSDELLSKGINVVPGEEVENDPVFRSLEESEEMPSETEFRDLWKIYFLALIGNYIFQQREENGKFREQGFDEAIRILQEAGLVPLKGLGKVLRQAKEFVNKFQPSAKSPEGWEYKLILREPTVKEEDSGKISALQLIKDIDELLNENKYEFWLLLDRLDVAFTRPEVEMSALRSLFRVYLDIVGLRRIKLKIFLRSDIWERITTVSGFREQSHITSTLTLSWDEESLRHLVLKRFFSNASIEQLTGINRRDATVDAKAQNLALTKIFPEQVERGEKKPTTFAWILGRVKDGRQVVAPRDVIELIEEARKSQVRKEEVGGAGSGQQDYLISPNALKKGLDSFSNRKIETYYSEYPELRRYIEAFEGKKTEYDLGSLRKLFESQGVLDDEVGKIVKKLTDSGFLEKRTSRKRLGTTFWVPFVFRPRLSLVRGSEFES